MKADPEQRAVQLGEYIAAHNATVRAAAAGGGGGVVGGGGEGFSAVKTISQSRIRPTAPFTQGSLSCYAVRKPMPQTKEKQRHSRCFSGVVCRSVVS